MGGRFRRLRLVTGALVLAGSAATVGVLATAGTASAGTLSPLSWSVSNNEISAATVTYTFAFKTATAGVIKKITMTVPTGTSGTPSVQNVGIGGGTATLASTTLTWTVTTAATVAAGTTIELVVSGLTNTSTAGTYKSKVTTVKSTTGTIDTATSQTVSFATSNTVVTVNVAESTTFSNTLTSFKLYMDPSLPTLSTQTKIVPLKVTTNAVTGFTLSVKDAGLKISTTHKITPVTTGMTSAATWPSGSGSRFGYNATMTGSTTGATLGGKLGTSGAYAGYTAAGETILTYSGPTGTTPLTLDLTNKVQIDYSTAAGTYKDTITYTVSPRY